MNPDSTPVRELINLGPASEKMLNAVGIFSHADLAETGAVPAFVRVRARGWKASFNLLYALEGALSGTHWARLPEDLRHRLITAADALESVSHLPPVEGHASMSDRV